MNGSPDLVSVLEAAYAVEEPEGAWLRGVVSALRPALEAGLGMAAYVYDTSTRPFVVREPILDCALDAKGLAALLASSDEAYVQGSWLSRAAATASETPGFDEHPGVREVFAPAGIHDVMVVNALDPVGIGCLVGALLPRKKRLAPAERDRWERVSAHLRAALRLRLRCRTTGATQEDATGRAEAVLRRTGEIEHLEASAENARAALREAVLGMERARRSMRREPKRALESWRALVRTRWTLVDDFQAGNARYVVARANGPAAPGPSVLAARERQVLAYVVMGHSDKMIAYELGLAHSTVRVLIARARAKLGAKSRGDLIKKFRASS
ncbi:MAG: helix-turn-helix transcriptional regulator [Labilithrix sp.]|nr:helix-turn-helix transcriptional regulator [Labilithrix sp.]